VGIVRHKLAEALTQADARSKEATDLQALWASRPVCYEEDAHLKPAVDTHVEEIKTSITELERCNEGMREQLKVLQDLHMMVTTDVTTKREGAMVDISAFQLQVGNNQGQQDSPNQSTSEMQTKEWVAAWKDLLQQTAGAIQASTRERKAANSVIKERGQEEDQASRSLLNALQEKQLEWKRLVWKLKNEGQDLQQQIDELSMLLDEVPGRMHIIESNMQCANDRLTERGSKSPSECKNDEAEEALVAEVEHFERLQAALEQHSFSMEEEKQECEDRLESLCLDLEDAEAVLQVDSSCLSNHLSSRAEVQLATKDRRVKAFDCKLEGQSASK